jgi:hypothetical protein
LTAPLMLRGEGSLSFPPRSVTSFCMFILFMLCNSFHPPFLYNEPYKSRDLHIYLSVNFIMVGLAMIRSLPLETNV